MSHRAWICLLPLLAMMVFSGCATTETVSLSHVFPPTGVKLPVGSRIQIMSFDGAPASSQQLRMIRDVLGKIRGIQVVTYAPDYWLVTGWVSGYKQASGQEAEFSSKTYRGVSEGHWGGHENVVIQPQVTTSCAMVATFSLVRASDLTPVTIFNVGVYDSDFSPKGGRAMGIYEVAFRQSLETKLREVFIPGNRSIVHQTAIPDNAPPELVAELGRGSHQAYASLPAFAQFCSQVSAGSFEGDREMTLTMYFLNFLNDELRCTDVETLQQLHRSYLNLIVLTTDDSLVEAASRGMARVEEKLRILGHRPLL